MTRSGLVILWLSLLFSTVVGLFWYNDWVYQLPTPVPLHYKPVSMGAQIDLGDQIGTLEEKPVFLHFYNPDCPCSRFNTTHFRSLVRSYSDQIQFAVVVLTDKNYSEKYIQKKIGLELSVSFDRSLANRCGVYATPQAVILDSAQKLFYRGNYNASRYCTDEKTAYAQIALEGLFSTQVLPDIDQKALTAYGCTLPVCKN
jgi:hypothetical protein